MPKKLTKPERARNLGREKQPVPEESGKADRMFPPTVEKYIRLADLALGKKAGKS